MHAAQHRHSFSLNISCDTRPRCNIALDLALSSVERNRAMGDSHHEVPNRRRGQAEMKMVRRLT